MNRQRYHIDEILTLAKINSSKEFWYPRGVKVYPCTYLTNILHDRIVHIPFSDEIHTIKVKYVQRSDDKSNVIMHGHNKTIEEYKSYRLFTSRLSTQSNPENRRWIVPCYSFFISKPIQLMIKDIEIFV